MAESLKSKRAIFPRGKQNVFLLQSKNELCIAWSELAEICATSVRNLNAWRNEKISISLMAVEKICKKRGCIIPEEIVLRDPYWYTAKGATIGGRAIIAKYGKVGGDESYRKKKWREWWEREGKFHTSKITQPLSFKKPAFSKDLAEFVGIILGDGGISRNQITVSLNRITDREYSIFVRKLIQKLFDIPTGLYVSKRSLVDRIVISRTALVSYLTEVLGLMSGNKVQQQVDVPEWVMRNRSYTISCVRGLIDTDGCIIIHRYLSKGKEYRYKKIGFTSRSHPLLRSVGKILSDLEIGHRVMKNGWDIRIEARRDVEKYFQIIGTHNSKHLKRYKVT